MTEIQGAKTVLQQTQRPDSLCQFFINAAELKFQHLLDKVCKVFHMVCDALVKESIMLISRGVLRREGVNRGFGN